jgi:hypothetical protein
MLFVTENGEALYEMQGVDLTSGQAESPVVQWPAML